MLVIATILMLRIVKLSFTRGSILGKVKFALKIVYHSAGGLPLCSALRLASPESDTTFFRGCASRGRLSLKLLTMRCR
jgi:hypothetical protein